MEECVCGGKKGDLTTPTYTIGRLFKSGRLFQFQSTGFSVRGTAQIGMEIRQVRERLEALEAEWREAVRREWPKDLDANP